MTNLETLKLTTTEKIIIKDSQIALVPDGNKLEVCNVIRFSVVEEEQESSFFASADTLEKDNTYVGIISAQSNYEWLWDTDKKIVFNIDSYPEELHPVIQKGINATRDLFNTMSKTKHRPIMIDYRKDEFQKDLDTYILAKDDFQKQVIKYKSVNGSVDLGSFIDRYWFKKHLLVQGEKGLGKTYTIDKKLTDEGLEHTFIAGHEGIESIDLLGYYIKDETGNLVWLDGVLSETFRKAKTDKCALFIDEILRIPSRELNILVGALTPSSRGTYRLRTNRIVDVIDGVGTTELLEVPVDNLWCVGTTNVGAGYQVDEIDSALSDRFRVVVKETSNNELEAILNSCASVNGISEKVIHQMISFYSQVKDFVVSGELEKQVNVRHLCEVLQFSKNDDEIKSYMLDLVHTWCSTDTNGNPNKSEKEIIVKMIKKMFV